MNTNTDCHIVSMMLCEQPVIVNNRAVISASDSVWNPIVVLPTGLDGVTDDLGNNHPNYAGTIFFSNRNAIDQIQKRNIMLCMRCVRDQDIPLTDCPLSLSIADFFPKPYLMGWDIVRGNGWVSASCDGYFPIDSTGKPRQEENIKKLNRYSLFDNLEDCLEYCELNNKKIPEWAPWYPVAIYCDPHTKSTIDALICDTINARKAHPVRRQ